MKTKPISKNIRDWHDPRGECEHNNDPTNDCTCKRRRTRKPFRKVKVHDTQAPAGVSSHLIAEIYPNGLLVLREAGRRTRYETTLGRVYAGCVWRDVMQTRKARKRKRSI